MPKISITKPNRSNLYGILVLPTDLANQKRFIANNVDEILDCEKPFKTYYKQTKSSNFLLAIMKQYLHTKSKFSDVLWPSFANGNLSFAPIIEVIQQLMDSRFKLPIFY